MGIQTKFDDTINAFVVKMPDYITLKLLHDWAVSFLKQLKIRTDKVGLLLDTTLHEFESLECLKFLRGFLTQEAEVENHIVRVAFIAPLKYRQPEIVNSTEAYFSDFDAAYHWLYLSEMQMDKP